MSTNLPSTERKPPEESSTFNKRMWRVRGESFTSLDELAASANRQDTIFEILRQGTPYRDDILVSPFESSSSNFFFCWVKLTNRTCFFYTFFFGYSVMQLPNFFRI